MQSNRENCHWHQLTRLESTQFDFAKQGTNCTDRLTAEQVRREQGNTKQKLKKQRKWKKAALVAGLIAAAVVFAVALIIKLFILDTKESSIVKRMKEAKVGDTVCFGVYEQDNDTSNGQETIKWWVLAKEDNRMLLVSEKGIDCQPYNTLCTDVTWETCSLRNWLNNTFLNTAFDAEEQALVDATSIQIDFDLEYDVQTGNTTEDKIFILIDSEVSNYLISYDVRQCKPTQYAIDKGAYIDGDNGNCWWWLRDPFNVPSSFTDIYREGKEGNYLNFVDFNDICVRPALWILLDA